MQNDEISYRVIIQDPATEMLVQHAQFLAQVSISAAERLISEFHEKAKSLEIMPERCPWLFDLYIPEYKYRKLLFSEYYLLLFQVIGTNVYIDAMVDCRQDYSWLL